MEIITSRQNPLIKTVAALTEKKKRKETGCFRLDGKKLVGEAVACGISFSAILLREDAAAAFLPLAESAVKAGLLPQSGVLTVSKSVFEKLTEEKSPEGIIGVAVMPKELHVTATPAALSTLVGGGEKILLAESLRDPGNLGTVMRSCAALGIDRLVLSDDCADLYSPKTARAAMGALFRLPTVTVASADFADAIVALQAEGRHVYATALHREARVIGEWKLLAGDCFVIGNEGHGLSPDVIGACDACAVIPMREGAESLNAAAAAAICIWETVRA
ncbi:MAG: RNA methyltransferase [Ruminococcaceae bacterium]|nr:RNA methyltransferase [Oscillospiraceae bacterium]